MTEEILEPDWTTEWRLTTVKELHVFCRQCGENEKCEDELSRVVARFLQDHALFWRN